MRLFWELAKLSFQRQLTYRTANLAGLGTNLFWGLLRAALLIALYGGRPEVAGISIQGAITYTGLSQAVITLYFMFGWYEVINSVYTGEVATDLLKPFNFFTFWMAQDLGRAFGGFLLRGVSIMAIYALIFKITVPTSSGQWLALGLAIILSWMVSFSWRFLVNLSAFWTPNARGIGRLAFTLSYFLSGFLMPLRFFPDWFVALCNLTPFPATVNTVVDVYLGVLQGPALAQAFLGQILWILILTGLCQLTLRAGIRQLVIQGG
ncbi:MAG: ABC-2 family transporter protein, partial [Chloroflexi bacterium]|nr:ABC-2 family transporter protein [Chloroflexota bacterium]